MTPEIIKKVFKVIGIILYVMAGFFIMIVSLFAFSNMPTETMKAKFGIMGIFAIPAVLLMIIGVAFNRFKKWKTAVGTVLISATGMVIFTVITFVCIRLDPNANKLFNQQTFDQQMLKQQMLRQQMIGRNDLPLDAFKSIPGNPFDMFSDYATGFSILLILLISGILLVRLEKRKLNNKEAACE
ncbi:MAG: hypothetical protein WA666_03640 [Nitrospirota bacterium]